MQMRWWRDALQDYATCKLQELCVWTVAAEFGVGDAMLMVVEMFYSAELGVVLCSSIQ